MSVVDDELGVVARHPQRNENRCDQLFGDDSIVRTDDNHYIWHRILKWKACWIGAVAVDLDRIVGPVGNESIPSVRGRTEAEELLEFQKGALLLDRSLPSGIESSWKRILDAAVTRTGVASETPHPTVDHTPTLLLQRMTYANPCFWTSTLYSVYLIMQSFSLERPRIVFMDGFAWTSLNSVWWELFDPVDVVHVKQLSPTTVYANTYVVNTVSAFSDAAMRYFRQSTCTPETSWLHKFRNFVWERYGLQPIDAPKGNESVGGTRTQRLTLLVREDYVAHPRSDGVLDRKVHDVEVARSGLQEEYPQHEIQVVSFENLPFREQLAIISQTDVLAAIHGAGNVHVIYLPPHATFVEYFPPRFTSRTRFQYLAECLGIRRIRKHANIVSRLPNSKISVELTSKVLSTPSFHKGYYGLGSEDLSFLAYNPQSRSTRKQVRHGSVRHRWGTMGVGRASDFV